MPACGLQKQNGRYHQYAKIIPKQLYCGRFSKNTKRLWVTSEKNGPNAKMTFDQKIVYQKKHVRKY